MEETADILHVPLFTAEALLRHAEWSRDILLKKWISDPVTTCQLAGVQQSLSSISRRLSDQFQQNESQQMGLPPPQAVVQHQEQIPPQLVARQILQPPPYLTANTQLHRQQIHTYGTKTLPMGNKKSPALSQDGANKGLCASSNLGTTTKASQVAIPSTSNASTIQNTRMHSTDRIRVCSVMTWS